MGHRVETLADKVETVDLSLIVEILKFDYILAKGVIGLFEAGNGNRALVDCPNAKNEPAEVFIILVGEDTVEDTRAEAIDV